MRKPLSIKIADVKPILISIVKTLANITPATAPRLASVFKVAKMPRRQYHARMEKPARQLELAEADFLGHAPETLLCNQCGGAFCGHRVGRVYQGKAFIMCGRKAETREILANLSRR